MKAIITILLGIVFFTAVYHTFVSAPATFPAPYTINVTSGETLSSISGQLVTDNVIRSRKVFEAFVVAFGGDKTISQGEYYFQNPTSALFIAMRISGKDFGIERQKVTFPEGFTNNDMADHLVAVFPNFDKADFLTLATSEQGYLFPDTYKFFPSLTPEMVIATMKANYTSKITPLENDIAASGHTESQIIIMASIIQKEAKGTSDSPTIAGILWKRIASGIPLQVDAAPETYKAKGLPSAPIDNPGLVAIQAALQPVSSPYLYYLHDSTGAIHYASTFAQHQQNIRKYLQ